MLIRALPKKKIHLFCRNSHLNRINPNPAVGFQSIWVISNLSYSFLLMHVLQVTWCLHNWITAWLYLFKTWSWLQIAEEALPRLLKKENIWKIYPGKCLQESAQLMSPLISVQRLSGTFTATLLHQHVQTSTANSRWGKRCPARGEQYHVASESFPLKRSGRIAQLWLWWIQSPPRLPFSSLPSPLSTTGF